MILELHITLDENKSLKIVGIPHDEQGRKITLQVLGEAVKTVAGLKAHDPHAIVSPHTGGPAVG